MTQSFSFNDVTSHPGVSFHPGFADGMSIKSLEAGTTLRVRTRNSTYRLVVLDPVKLLVLLVGGALFPEDTVARLAGATAGGTTLKVGWIGLGLRVEIAAGGKRTTTSPVESIEIASPIWPSPVPRQ
jgi:hypothetical protein